jgi:hypothetical protein
MIPKLIVIFGCFAVLILSVNSRLVRRDPKELESASRFGEIIVVGGAFLAGFLALWDTAMNRGGVWGAIFIPYSILGVLAGSRAKKRMDALVLASRSAKKN